MPLHPSAFYQKAPYIQLNIQLELDFECNTFTAELLLPIKSLEKPFLKMRQTPKFVMKFFCQLLVRSNVNWLHEYINALQFHTNSIYHINYAVIHNLEIFEHSRCFSENLTCFQMSIVFICRLKKIFWINCWRWFSLQNILKVWSQL